MKEEKERAKKKVAEKKVRKEVSQKFFGTGSVPIFYGELARLRSHRDAITIFVFWTILLHLKISSIISKSVKLIKFFLLKKTARYSCTQAFP
jgi:hypothetical protein